MILLFLRKLLKYSLRFLLYFVIFVLLYLAGSWIFSRIEVGPEETTDPKEITAFIKSNNVHTDIVLPVNHELMDWSALFPYANTRSKDTAMRYIALGWGDKGFYLNTPTWGDLTFSTAFKAAFGLSSTAMHVTYYPDIQPNDSNCVQLRLTRKQYQRVIAYVLESLQKSDAGKVKWIPTKAVYGENDAFYDATGTYSMFSTCNSWTNGALKEGGQKAGLWVPFEGGIFCHYLKE